LIVNTKVVGLTLDVNVRTRLWSRKKKKFPFQCTEVLLHLGMTQPVIFILDTTGYLKAIFLSSSLQKQCL
jgi:hypothetical protein